MNTVKPKIIIPLSKEVEKSLKKMKNQGKLPYAIGRSLPHPYYYSNFTTRYEEGKKRYIELIKNYIL